MKKRLPTLDEFINEQSKTTYNYGCLMVNVDEMGWDGFIKETVNDEDLYTEGDDYGIETEPHITVLYGFHKDIDMKKLKELLFPLSELEITSSKISIFENEKYDVLKYDIDSDKLFELNDLMTENFEYTTDFPDYHPHVTIAYLKPGRGKKYVTELKEAKEFKAKTYKFSHPDGKKEFIKK
jgi:hypothetical protein